MDFLTIETNLMPDNNYEMKIVFAGDSIIKVISEVIEVTLDDQGDAWEENERYDDGVNGINNMNTLPFDNIPYENWGRDVYVGQEIEIDLYESENGFFDPLSVTNRPDLWHRGYPLKHVPTKNNVTYLGKTKRRVLVQADLWDICDPHHHQQQRDCHQHRVRCAA